MKILLVLACLALCSAALADGHGGVFKTPEVTAPSPQGHGGVFAKPRVSDGHGGVIK